MKRNNMHFRLAILRQWLISSIIFSVLYIVTMYFVHQLFLQNNSFITAIYTAAMEFFSDIYTLIFIVYFILMGIITFIFMITAAGYVEKSYKAVSNITADKRVNINYPKIMTGFKIKVLEVENELLFREKAAREAEQKKNDLIVYLAHDLKTPLTSIIGYLSILKESTDLSIAYRAKYTNITLDKAYRLEQLINEFFDITRFNLQSVVLEHNRIDLTMLLNQITEEFYPVLNKKGITAQTYIKTNINLIGDADKLARVFDNLLRNAANYSYPDTLLKIYADTDENYAYIRIRNTGDEIPEEKLKLIFEKFFRADSARATQSGGAGLGLAIAKEIVELHKGTINAVSNREYTEFTVKLPLKM